MPLHDPHESPSDDHFVSSDSSSSLDLKRKGNSLRSASKCNTNFPCLPIILLAFIHISVAYSTQKSQQPHHHYIHSRKYHEETSFAVLQQAGEQVLDVKQEIRETISGIEPHIDESQLQAAPRNVTAQIGHHVYLHCVVEPIGDRMVSWLRLRDFHLLTVGLYTYTPDDRFVVRQGVLQPNDWALQIKHVTPVDEGIYECQVNTDPPRSQYYRLQVIVPETRMIGSPDMFVRAGSSLNLTCIISKSPELPAFVFWYHNERMINYDYESKEKGRISLSKDPVKPDTGISQLLIRKAKVNDSGNYSCHFVGSGVEPAHIYVHVLQGERRQSDQLQNDENQKQDITANTALSSCLTGSTMLLLAASVSLLLTWSRMHFEHTSF